MTIWKAIALKDWPARQWPVWSNTYHFALDPINTWDQTRIWTDDVRRWERLVHDARVNHRLAGWWNMDADQTAGSPACWFHPIIKGVPGDAREVGDPVDFHIALRVRHSDGVQRPGSHMYRGALGEEHINHHLGGLVGLKAIPELQELLLGSRRKQPGEIFNTLLIHHSNPIGPGFDWTAVEYVDVMGATTLNAARRAMAKHLNSTVTTFPALIAFMEAWYSLSELWYGEWFLLDLPDYYPLGVKQQIQFAAGMASAYADAVLNFFNDIDPDVPGTEDSAGRFGITASFIIEQANKLKTTYLAWVESINHEQPFLFAGDLFWHRPQIETFWGQMRDWNKLMAPALFWDWMDSTRAKEGSKVRGGYIPLHPEIDPTTA